MVQSVWSHLPCLDRTKSHTGHLGSKRRGRVDGEAKPQVQLAAEIRSHGRDFGDGFGAGAAVWEGLGGEEEVALSSYDSSSVEDLQTSPGGRVYTIDFSGPAES